MQHTLRKKWLKSSSFINILNSCPIQGRVEGWDAMKPRYCRSVNGRPRLSHHHKGRWNETKWMRWVWRNGGMKLMVGENGRNPAKNLPRPRFVHLETHMEWPISELGTPAVGGERLTACAISCFIFTFLIFPSFRIKKIMTVYHSPIYCNCYPDDLCWRNTRNR